MNELVKLVSQKTGLSEEKSKMAIDVVLSYLKTKLPAPIAAQMDTVLAGGDALGNAQGVIQGIGGLFGKK